MTVFASGARHKRELSVTRYLSERKKEFLEKSRGLKRYGLRNDLDEKVEHRVSADAPIGSVPPHRSGVHNWCSADTAHAGSKYGGRRGSSVIEINDGFDIGFRTNAFQFSR
jgi:hypothetical protein